MPWIPWMKVEQQCASCLDFHSLRYILGCYQDLQYLHFIQLGTLSIKFMKFSFPYVHHLILQYTVQKLHCSEYSEVNWLRTM